VPTRFACLHLVCSCRRRVPLILSSLLFPLLLRRREGPQENSTPPAVCAHGCALYV
jgi:hypothetical protein